MREERAPLPRRDGSERRPLLACHSHHYRYGVYRFLRVGRCILGLPQGESQYRGTGLNQALILVVEDEALIAMDLQFLLEEAGYRVLGPASNVTRAFNLVDKLNPDLALLDVNLGGADVFAFADALASRSVRMIFLTGHSVRRLPETHRHRPLVGKPFLPSIVLDAVRRELQASGCGAA